jgi:hypothetical protein
VTLALQDANTEDGGTAFQRVQKETHLTQKSTSGGDCQSCLAVLGVNSPGQKGHVVRVAQLNASACADERLEADVQGSAQSDTLLKRRAARPGGLCQVQAPISFDSNHFHKSISDSHSPDLALSRRSSLPPENLGLRDASR